MKHPMKYVIPVVLAALAANDPADAADNLFLSIDGIDGESVAAGHEGEIDIIAWSWNLSRDVDLSGGGSGQATIGDIKIIKRVDKSSNDLMLRLLDGTSLAEAIITVRREGGAGGPVDYLKITMSTVIVTRFSTGGQASDSATTETIGLNFAAVCLAYSFVNPDGSVGAPEETCWDIVANKPV